MSYTKETIYKRLEDAANDLAKAKVADRNNKSEDFTKHSRDAGEAISQSLEFALKYHLSKIMSAVEKKNFYIDRANIHDLIGKYIDDDGSPGDYFYSSVIEPSDPTVDFIYLKNNKKKLTNEAKHEGTEPDFEIQLKYFTEVGKFLKQYIDSSAKVKTVEFYESVDFSSWELFYTNCDRFNQEERNYILVIGENSNVDKEYLRQLSKCKWDLIVDFDYNSKTTGFFNVGYGDVTIAPHQIKAADQVNRNTFSLYNNSHYHYFANNFAGSGHQMPRDYNDWNRKYGRNVDQLITSFISVFQNQKTIIVILYPEFRFVNALCERFYQSIGSSLSMVIANDVKNNLESIVDYFAAVKVNISIPEIARGIKENSSNFGFTTSGDDIYELPFLTTSETKDVTGVFTKEEFAKLEEDFEVFHLGLPKGDANEERKDFLSGKKKLSYFGMKYRFDVENHNFSKKYIKPIEKLIEKGKGKVSLQHEAGFGGSTIARRIAWEIHGEYPTLILKKFRESKVREQIITLHQKTRKTLFIVMEVPQVITLDEVESLYRSIPPARPVVFLIVKRGKPGNNDLSVTDWGNNVSDLVNEFKPYLKDFNSPSVQAKKQRELDLIIHSSEPFKKTPFYIGLLSFDEQFFAIKEYINNFVIEVRGKELQRKILIYLSLAYDYLGQGLPASFFRGVVGFTNNQNEIFKLEDFFGKDTSIISSLLNSKIVGKQKFWSIRHAFLAKELKTQLLSGGSENPELWKNELANYSISLIEDSVSESIESEYIDDLLQKIFIGNRKDREGDDYTPIITDIPSIDEKESVFVALKEAYPSDPHYYSHLARFYAYNNKNYQKAIEYANEAIELSKSIGIDDPFLHHIKGMCLRTIVFDLMDQQIKMKRSGKTVDSEDYENIIYKLIPEAEAEFTISREIIHRDNRIDAHGYVAHIQLLIRSIDYAIAVTGMTKTQFLSDITDPFSSWLDLAESLLEDVKGMNQQIDNSGKIEECENGIEEIYENYEVVLQNLRNQLSKSSNPGRTRRKIVRVYMRRSSDYVKDIKIVDTILDLLQENIQNEPDNEKNFFLWFQVARFSNVSIEKTLTQMLKWKAQSTTIESVFYLYILKVIKAIDGYSDAAIEAFNLISECRAKGRANISTYEWYGKGNDLKRLVNRRSFTEENKHDRLEYVKGVFTDFAHDGSGIITIVDKLKVFFSPTQAKITSSDLNKTVEFYLGFSYDGLRADSNSVRIIS